MAAGMLPRPGMPPFLNRLKQRAELTEDWFMLDEEGLRKRLEAMGYGERSINKEVDDFLAYKERTAVAAPEEPEEETAGLEPTSDMTSRLDAATDKRDKGDTDD